MAYNQPFQESTRQTPWDQQDGPRFGNAYEQNNNAWSSPYQQQPQQPRLESNKTEYIPSPPPVSTNLYQYTGTRLGQQDVEGSGNAYSGITNNNNNPASAVDDHKLTTTTQPNLWRLLLRVILLVAAIGHLGFAAGASPYSGESPPLTASGCFYYLYVVAALTILYSIYHIGYYCFRRFMGGMKTTRALMTACDVVLAVMWGVGIIIEAAKYQCPPGQYNGWCNFYNVSIFFGFVCFVGFALAALWDLVGGCIAHKRTS